MKSVGRLRTSTLSRQAVSLAAIILGALLLPGCILLSRRATDLGPNVGPGDQPDKVLFAKAKAEIDHGRYDVGRLTLQTLINTYPDSEFLSKAKLLTADSYYKEGGVSGLTQAEAEYNDFITFFPTAPEAPEAKYRAGMSHFRLMGKPDRDLTEALDAQQQFKEFLEKYPDNSLVPVVKGRLREVQEVLAQGDYETATLYYKHGVNRAAASRFQEIADSFPDFSMADHALWYLGQANERLRKPDQAATAYARLLSYYPLSSDAQSAKGRLIAMHKPVPKATKATLARARADRSAAQKVHTSWMERITGEFTSAPDLSATRHGPVLIGPRHPAGVVAAQAQNPVTGEIAVQPVNDSTPPAAPAATSPAAKSPAAKPAPSPSAPPTPAPDEGSANRQAPAGATDEPPAATDEPATATAEPTAKANSKAKGASGDSDNPKQGVSSTRKKGKFHFLKKIIP